MCAEGKVHAEGMELYVFARIAGLCYWIIYYIFAPVLFVECGKEMV